MCVLHTYTHACLRAFMCWRICNSRAKDKKIIMISSQIFFFYGHLRHVHWADDPSPLCHLRRVKEFCHPTYWSFCWSIMYCQMSAGWTILLIMQFMLAWVLAPIAWKSAWLIASFRFVLLICRPMDVDGLVRQPHFQLRFLSLSSESAAMQSSIPRFKFCFDQIPRFKFSNNWKLSTGLSLILCALL